MKMISADIELTKPTMFFIGVSTHNSFVNLVFHDWLKIIGKDADLVGINLGVECDINEYRDVVSCIKSNRLALGSLVTTHKVRLYESVNYLFNNLSEECKEFKEIGCIYKNANALCGEVTDLDSVGLALKSILPQAYLANNLVDFCILGGGGAGLALAYNVLVHEKSKPKKLILTDISDARLKSIENILKKYDTGNILDLRLTSDITIVDKLIANLSSGSIIVNATGLGKDRIGSPFSENVSIPSKCILWDFNYRGELDFLKIARKQSSIKKLTLIDGWIYFIHGWSQVMSKVFHVENIDKYFDKFVYAADLKRI